MFNSIRRCRRFLCGMLAAVLFLNFPAAAETLSELRAQQESLQALKEENDTRLENLRNDTEQKKAYRDTLYGQIDTVQSQIDLLRRQIAELDDKIAVSRDRIALKQDDISRNFDLLKKRIKALYVTGDASTLAVILDSDNFVDFTEKVQFLRAVTRHDRELIDKLTMQLSDMEQELADISDDKQELGSEKKELDSKGAELTKLYEEAQRAVESAENEELNALTDSELLGSQIEENEAAIAELEKQLRQQAAAETPGKGTGNGGIAPSTGYVGSGSFLWPMPGYTYLTCYFGERGHRGIDIAGSDIYGKPIIAADGGSVIFAGWNDSYGYCVFLDHGNGFQTRYAHMSALAAEPGINVEKGQIIGFVGSTGNSSGPHLHFEVIENGGLTNPMFFF